MSKPTIICVGAGTQDVFLHDKLFSAHREDDGQFQELALGSKNDIGDITFSTGGGATNAAVTFARRDLTSYFLGRLGHDIAGQGVAQELEHNGVNTSLVLYSDKYNTGYSTLLVAPNGERTVLVYRGASAHFDFAEHDFKDVKAEWMYISSLSGDLDALGVLIRHAHKNGIKVAINPGKGELAEASKFKEFLPDITILSVNKEEAQKLFEGETSEQLVRRAVKHVPVVLVTDGPKGSVASDGNKLYKAGMYEDVKVVDRTGAGDAFSSGFTSVMAEGGNIDEAMIFASANSTSVVGKIGAKAGILSAGAHLHAMPITISDL